MSIRLFFLLNCMNAPLHRACCLLQVQAHPTALGDAKTTVWTRAMLPSRLATRAGCAVDCFVIQLVTKWPPLSISSALQKPGLASDVRVTDFICPFVSDKMTRDWNRLQETYINFRHVEWFGEWSYVRESITASRCWQNTAAPQTKWTFLRQ